MLYLLFLRPPSSTLFPYTTLFRSHGFQFRRRDLQAFVLNQLLGAIDDEEVPVFVCISDVARVQPTIGVDSLRGRVRVVQIDRKSTRLNSSHSQISYAVFCLKKKTH